MNAVSQMLDQRILEVLSGLVDLGAQAESEALKENHQAACCSWSEITSAGGGSSAPEHAVFPKALRIGTLFSEALTSQKPLAIKVSELRSHAQGNSTKTPQPHSASANSAQLTSHEIGYPALIPLGKRPGLFFQSPQGGGAKSEKLLQSIALRILCSMPPRKVKVHLIDFQTKGRAFGILGALDHQIAPIVAPTEEGVSQLLREMEARVSDVTRRCLARHDWLTDYNAAYPEEAEDFHLVCVSDFPVGLGKEHSDAINRLLLHECGARGGVYILFSSERPLSDFPELAGFPSVFTEEGKAEIRDAEIDTSSSGALSDLMLLPDTPPDDVSSIVDNLNQALSVKPKAKRVSVSVHDSMLWNSSAVNGVAIPIGKAGRDELLFRLGNDSVVHHALIGGATGTGKTILLHNIILNAAELYSPEDLQMILMDFKEGTEFACYDGLPHMRVLSIASELHFGHSVFEWLVSERMRRADLFKKSGVANLADFVKKTGQKLPRILVLMDEFQRLLSDPHIGSQVSLLLDDIVRTGRSFGINLILSTQSLANVQMEASTLTSLGLRICLRLSESETIKFLGYDNTVPVGFSQPGQAVYNETEGRQEGNTAFQVGFIDVSEIPARCHSLRERETERFGRRVVEDARVFHGEMPVNPTGRVPAAASDRLQAYIGEPLRIQAEPVAVTFEQQDGSNLVVIGQSIENLNTLSNNLAIQFLQSPLKPEIFVADALPLAKERWTAAIGRGVQFLSSPIKTIDALDQISLELENRKSQEQDGSFPPKVLFIIEPQLNKAFPPGNGIDSSPSALMLNTLLEQGPRLGVHVVLMSTRLARTAKLIGQFDRLNMQHFANRLAFRTDEAEALLGYDAPAKNIGEFSGVISSEVTGETTLFQAYDTINT